MNKFNVQGESVMKKRWNDKGIASHYTDNRFAEPVWKFMHDKEVSVVNSVIKPEMTILDVATGPARVASDLKGFKEGVACDFAEEMLEVARERLSKDKWKIKKEDAFNLSFPSEKFDLVTSFRFVRHFDLTDRERIYKQVKRVLKPGGYFIFEALNKNMDKSLFKPRFTGAADNSIYDELYADKHILIKELEDNGFEVNKVVSNVNLGSLYSWLEKNFSPLGKSNLVNLFMLMDQLDFGRCFQWEVVAINKK